MRALILCLLLFCSAGWASPSLAQTPNPPPTSWRDPDLGQLIWAGSADDQHLWLLGQTGKVVAFDRRTGARQVVAEGVRNMLRDGDRLWVLIHEADGASYRIRDLRQQGAAPTDAPERSRLYLHAGETGEGEALSLAVWPGDGRPAVMAQRVLAVPTSEGWERHPFAAALDLSGRLAAAAGGNLYVGYNRGEWGGGLRRIDIASGSVSIVTRPAETICGGDINPECAPVVGVFRDPERDGCVLTGVGLAHMGLRLGKVFRVCGDDIETVFAAPPRPESGLSRMPNQTGPFSSLTPTADGWIAISDGRYFRSQAGAIAEHPFSAFSDWSGLRISEEQEGALFVVSACCWGSVSNPTLFSVIAVPVRK